jgi:hypothetical protein
VLLLSSIDTSGAGFYAAFGSHDSMQVAERILLRRQHMRLPKQRVQIFDEFTKMLLELRPDVRSEGARFDSVMRHSPAMLRRHIRALALWLQQHRPSRTASKREVLAVLEATWLKDHADDPENATQRERVAAVDAASTVLEDLQQVTGMIIERGYDAFGFSHLTYQEFFAAEALASMSIDTRWAILRPVMHHARWRETVLLCAGHIGVLQVRVDDVDQLAGAVAEARSEFESLLFRDAFLAADMAVEGARNSARVLSTIATGLEAPLNSDIQFINVRAIAGIVGLARVGHAASIDRILEWVKAEEGGHTKLFTQHGHAFLYQLMNESTCQPVTNWARQQLHSWLDEPKAHISSQFRHIYSIVPYFIKSEPALRVKILHKVINSSEDWLFLRPEFFGNEPELRTALLRLATNSRSRQPALLRLAERIPEDPDVEKLLEDGWNDPDPNIHHAVLRGAVRLAPKWPRWKQRLLDEIEQTSSIHTPNTINQIGVLARTDHDFRARYIRLMRSSNRDIARAAADALAPLLKTESSLRQEFLLHLERPDVQLRQNALTHLTHLGGTVTEITMALRARLIDPEPAVRCTALRALAPFALEDTELRDRFTRCLTTLEACVESDRIDTVAPMTRVDEPTLRRIAASIKSEERRTRLAALRALGPMAVENREVRGLMIECLDDADATVQMVAIDLLRPSIPHDTALLSKLLTMTTSAEKNVHQHIAEALAPFYASSPVQDVLISRLNARQTLGPNASKAILDLSVSDPAILTKVHDIVADEELRRSGLDWIFNLIDALLDRDDVIFKHLRRYTHDKHLAFDALRLLLRHPKLPGIKPILLDIARHDDIMVRIRALRGLLVLALEDQAARQALLELLRDRKTLNLIDFSGPLWNVWVHDEPIRQLLLEATRPLPDFDHHFDSIHILRTLSNCVAQHSDVEIRFRELLLEHRSGDLAANECAKLAALGLAPLATHDADLRAILLPWLGVRTHTGDSTGASLRRALADAFAPVVREDDGFRRQIIAMLESVAWQVRQGAAWTLIAAGGDVLRDALERLRGLLDDDRADESWIERLHAAAALINHPDPSLSRNAIAVAHDALRYGSEAWHQPLCAQVRQQAAETLGQIQPIRRDSALTSYIVQAFEEERNEQVRDSLYHALLRLASVADTACT